MKWKYLVILCLVLSFGCEEMKKEQKKNMLNALAVEDSLAIGRNEKRMLEIKGSCSLAVIVAQDKELSEYSMILQNADMATTLVKDNGPYTVFAPINEALDSIDFSGFDENEWTDFSKVFILNTSLPLETLKAKFENQQQLLLENMEGSKLKFIIKDADIYMKSASGELRKLEEPSKTSNGFLYTINEVPKRH